jgi:hypothetical protein
LVLLAQFTTSCLDYTEVVTLRADGSVLIQATTALSDFTAGLGGEGKLPLDGEQSDENGSSRTWTERKDGKLLTHLESELKDVRKSLSLAPIGQPFGELSPEWYGVQSLGFGRYRLTRSISLPGMDEGAGTVTNNPLGKLGATFGQHLMDTMLDGYEVTIRLNAPLILDCNADEVLGKQGAVWKRDLTSLAKGEEGALFIDATVLLLDYRMLAIGGGALLLTMVLLVAIIRRRQSRRSASPASSSEPGAGL